MKNMHRIYSFMLCLIISALSMTATAQMTISTITNQNMKDILEEYFLGEGVKIDTTRPIYFNNQTVVNNNQIGIFTNTDTSYSGKNIPIKSGLILATTACKSIGSSGGGGSIQNKLTGAATNAPALYLSYKNYCSSEWNIYGNTLSSDGIFHCVAVLDFWVIPQACEMSFKYCFGSEEYPTWVCTSFNDFFGLYCDGPYDDDLDPYTEKGTFYSNPTNIAVIPGSYDEDDFTSGTPVMINTCNNKNGSNSCGGENSNFFIDNRNKTCKTTTLGGYTRRLTTAKVQTVPGKKYHICIAICNMNDEAMQSAVFLEAGSFSAEKIDVEHKITATPGGEGYEITKNSEGDTNYVFIKGCSTDTMILHANYVATSDELEYLFLVQPSEYSNIIRGTDYDYFKINDDGSTESLPAANTITMPEGDTIMRFLLEFYANPNKECGTKDTLYFISTDCNQDPVDTVYYVMKEPCQMEYSVTGGLTTCHDLLPVKDSIKITIDNAVSYAYINAKRGGQVIYEDTMRNSFFTKDTVFSLAIPVVISAVDDTASVTITAEDYCGRSFDTVIYYKVLTSATQATADKVYICQGDSVELSCPEAASYIWSASPDDMSLLAGDNSKIQNPVVSPTISTTYSIKSISEEGCISYDSIKISVEPIIKAEMELNPKKVYYSNPEITFKDLSDDAYDRQWYFGDGTTSSSFSGYHTYKTDTAEESHTYEVMLIVFNKAMCPDTITDSVEVVSDFTFWVPNAFVPGYNESSVAYFGPKGALLKDWEMYIYNRWGTKIYQGKEKMWDGKLESGDMAPQGTYIYYIMYKDGHGLPQRKSGTFTLLPADGNK